MTFSNLSTGDYETSLWDFGDGETSTAQNPVHTYNSAGVYTVSLAVSGPGGSDVLTRTGYVTVYERVQAGFVYSPTAGTAPLTVVFTNTSSGDYVSSHWDFGDGGTGTQMHPTHTYTQAGSFSVTLRVSGPGGSSAVTEAHCVTVEAQHRVYLPMVVRSLDGSGGTSRVGVSWDPWDWRTRAAGRGERGRR